MSDFFKKPAPTKFVSAVNSNFNGTPPRPRNQSVLHARLVQALVTTLASQRQLKVIAASMPSFPEPTKQGRHAPDVFAVSTGGLPHLGEAKTGDNDLNTQHSREQFLDFSNRVTKDKSLLVPFHIAVPKSAELALRNVLSELGLLARPNIFIWTM